MKLSARLLVNYANINQFSYQDQWQIRAGEPNVLYFQLVDLDQNSLRHLAGIGVSNQPYSVSVKFPSIDNAQVIVAAATQVDISDSSIWKVSLSATQTPQSGNVVFTVVEGSASRSFNSMNGLSVEIPGNNGSC